MNFLLTPYIVKILGKEIYGFVGLATTFTSYVTIFTVALNSMVSRFVTIKLQKREITGANIYFSSVAIVNIVLTLILILPAVIVILFMERFLNIPPEGIYDIKLLWVFIFGSFYFDLATSVLGVSMYATNRLDLSAKRDVESNILKAIVVVILFYFMAPRVWYIGLSTLIAGLYCIIIKIHYTKTLTPDLTIKLKYFRFSAVKELVGIGIWSSINQLNQALINGLDLLISNIYLGALSMALMSYSKTVPMQLLAFITIVSNTFAPQMTISYANGDMEIFKKDTNNAIKMSGFFCSIPIIGFLAFGKIFYSLWLPMMTSSEIFTIQVLSIMALLPNVFGVYIYPLYSVNTITCKLKVPVLVSFGMGVINILLVLFLLKVTTFGVFAVKIVSCILLVARVLVFTPIYAALSINEKWYTFYKPLFRGMLSTCIILLLYIGITYIMNIDSWMKLFIICAIAGGIGYLINYLVVFNKQERARVNTYVYSKIKKII
jgi:O-antigen/teichoic acid export membrane protein